MRNTFDNWQDTGNELAHYGVLGMKWGYRKDPKKTYEKAAAKKRQLDMRAANGSVKSAGIQKKIAKTELQSNKLKQGIKKAGEKGNQEKVTKLQGRQTKLNAQMDKLKMQQAKADVYDAKTQLKAAKWTQSMLKVFGTTNYAELERKYGSAS